YPAHSERPVPGRGSTAQTRTRPTTQGRTESRARNQDTIGGARGGTEPQEAGERQAGARSKAAGAVSRDRPHARRRRACPGQGGGEGEGCRRGTEIRSGPEEIGSEGRRKLRPTAPALMLTRCAPDRRPSR